MALDSVWLVHLDGLADLLWGVTRSILGLIGLLLLGLLLGIISI
ncbi:unnamed protein product [Acidithrix sp. C25]|nr:unnamed protein product [Acidithrix sp. C25]